jgi:transposase
MKDDVELRKPPDPELPYYKTLKTSLASVLKLRTKHETITDAVKIVDKIVSRSWMFLKLYMLHHRDDPPKIDINLVDAIFKTIAKGAGGGRPPGDDMRHLRERLRSFYETHFAPLLPENDVETRYTHLNTALDYAAKQMVTVFETNIKHNYVDYVESFVNAAWQKKDLIERIRRTRKTKKLREQAIRKLTTTLRNIKTDLLNVGSEPLKSHRSYHAWITRHKGFVLPRKIRYDNDLLYYDIQCHPQDYHPGMLWITEYLENDEMKIRSWCPLRTSVIPKHICLDTTTLVHLLWSKDLGKKTSLLTGHALVKNKDKIWATFFRTDMKVFSSKDYVFNHMIHTDGVSASILLVRRDLAGKRAPKKKRVITREQYIDDITDKETISLSSRKVVGIDPNMSYLLYCVGEDTTKHYRYTQNQRRQESKTKKYGQIHLNEKNHTIVEGRNIIEWDTDLSDYNHKTVDFDDFKAYVKAKLYVTEKTESFYHQRVFRKLKLNTFWNTRRSEQWMLDRFGEIFGTPDGVVIGIGDWEQKRHRKWKEPVKGKGFRSLLRRGGYMVYLVDEFRTSCQCSHCQHEGAKCVKFRVRLDPNTKKSMDERRLGLVHGLLVCKTCNRLWNRDVNSAINIARLTREVLDGRERPQYLSRKRPAEPDSAVTSTA